MEQEHKYGTFQKLMADPAVSEIMINGPRKVFAERNGTKYLTDITFANDNEVLQLVEKIYADSGKRVDQEMPYGDVCMEDGTRINTILAPVSRFGIAVTIRKFSKNIGAAEDLVRMGTLNKKGLDFLRACVKGKLNMLISGGTGVGKTTILQMLSQYFDPKERVIIIEDSTELRIEQPNVISLEARSPDRDGRGGVSLRDLIRNSLRMSPDRLLVGEIRGGEAIDMIQAMAVGKSGTIGIVHGNSTREVISRLETMILMSGINLPLQEIRKLIGSTIQVLVHMAHMEDGGRRVVSITEIRGVEGDEYPKIIFNDLFTYQFLKRDEHGKDVFGLKPFIKKFPLFNEKLSKLNLITNKVFEAE